MLADNIAIPLVPFFFTAVFFLPLSSAISAIIFRRARINQRTISVFCRLRARVNSGRAKHSKRVQRSNSRSCYVNCKPRKRSSTLSLSLSLSVLPVPSSLRTDPCPPRLHRRSFIHSFSTLASRTLILAHVKSSLSVLSNSRAI